MSVRFLSSIALLALLSTAAWGQQYVYPAKGQSPAQQKSDESACHTGAVQQSGFDPARPPPTAAAPAQPTTATGTRPGAGAVAARSQSRRQNASAAQASHQQAAAASQQQQASFAKACAACLEGRGYTVQ